MAMITVAPASRITALKMRNLTVLQEAGETYLFGKLKERQLEHKDCGHLRQSSRPAAGKCGQRFSAEDRKRNKRRPHRNGEQCHQIPPHRDTPAHTAPGKINNTVASCEGCSHQECGETDTKQP